MNCSVRWTGRLLAPLARDLKRLVGYGYPKYWPLTWLPNPDGGGVFFPPGMWYDMTPGPGFPWLWHLPPPHHPMEAITALRGWGGIEGQNEQPDWVRERSGSWLGHTAHLGAYLFITPAETRLLWHILTPMRTNGGMPDNWVDKAEMWRTRLYTAAGLAHPGYCAKAAWQEVALPRTDRPPTRMQFWGDEVRGEVEL